ncbi:MAG: ABC transporter substrate-binding protein [Pantoea sp.]|nr:ABC transporter substrate-binding protein [Pantoea sp.]
MALHSLSLSRRTVLRGLATLGAGIGLSPVFTGSVLAEDPPLKTIKLAWGQTAVCQSPISVALKQGFFKKYGLNVEPVNFSGPTDALLQAIATGQADGGIGMALRWLKPLEQGFDVDLTVGTHGGCMRLLTPENSNIRSVKDLVGKSVAVTDQASPIRNFFAIQLAKQGIDPDKAVNWLQYPADLFGEALRCAARWCATIPKPRRRSPRRSSTRSSGPPTIRTRRRRSFSHSCPARCRLSPSPRC